MRKLSLLPLVGFLLGGSLNAAAFEENAGKLGADGSISAATRDVVRATVAGIDAEQLEIIKGLLPSVPTKQEHTKYGLGNRWLYPDSEARNMLKKGQNPEGIEDVYFAAEGPGSPVACVWGVGKPGAQAWSDPIAKPETTLREYRDMIYEQVKLGRKRVTSIDDDYAKLGIKEEDLDKRFSEVVLNPGGRTGIYGPGELGTLINYASDPGIASVIKGRLKIALGFRKDGHDTDSRRCVHGGMVDPTDLNKNATAKRELKEETSMEPAELIKNNLLYEFGEVYDGYSDDVRNTNTHFMWTTGYGYLLLEQAITPEFLEKLKISNDEITESSFFDVEDILSGKIPTFAGHRVIIANMVRKMFEIAAQQS